MRGPAAGIALLVAAGLAGCSFSQQYGPGNSFILHVRNDTAHTVTVIGPGPASDTTTLARHAGVYMYAPNDHSGAMRLQVVSGGKSLGCLAVHYAKGQAGKFMRVSDAAPCASTTHSAASHWIGIALIVVAVLALLLLLEGRVLRQLSPAAAESFEARVPAEWRVPIAWVVLWVGPALVAVAHPSWWGLQSGGNAARFSAAFGLLIALVGAGALLQRSHAAWWILVALEVVGVAIWIQHVARHGLGIQRALSGLLSFGTLVLLVSAPMRRFVRLRGRLAPGPG